MYYSSDNMLTVSSEQLGVTANDNVNSRVHNSDGSGEEDHPRKKARVSTSQETSNSLASARVNLRVDVNAMLLSSPRHVPNVRRSQIASVGDGLISDEHETSDGGNCKYQLVLALFFQFKYIFQHNSHFNSFVSAELRSGKRGTICHCKKVTSSSTCEKGAAP